MSTALLPKRTMVALEKVFVQEIDGRMLQSNARIYTTLAEQGYVKQVTEVFGAGTRFPVRCVGYVLTHAGRYAYCRQAAKEEEEDAEDVTEPSPGEKREEC